MKKILVLLAIMLLIPSFAWAVGPFLVSDPHSTAISFELEMDGSVVTSEVQGDPGALMIHHDLASLIDGNHEVRARACDLWDCSEWTPFLTFDKKVPSSVDGLTIKLE